MPSPSQNNALLEISPLAQLDRLLRLCNEADYEGTKLLADACSAKLPKTTPRRARKPDGPAL